ncbi:nuclear pore complex protein NUP1-like isoform X1 [Triticum urartu]|uniref:Nuclear pore complex protein NUP1 n=2 Tax=Triticum urartu TaxID=4572 RepID=A0A8R7UD54_TRIUA|nr:nuclear pore complex protein NUP1-like isoform X1 [Triticum urartu]
MASRGGYDGGSATGGKIRRRPPSRVAAASPYALPAAPTHPASYGGEGSGWLARLISGGASRLLSSVFRKPPPQLAAPTLSEPELVDAPCSPPPPPLENDILEEENGGGTANNLSTDNPENYPIDGDDILSSCFNGSMDLEELLKQKTFTRSEFEYLTGLLRSRTVESNTMQSEVNNIKQTLSLEKEKGSRDLPVDFSIKSYSITDQVASPAELAKAYMGSRCSEGAPLRLRLHEPSSLSVKSIESGTIQIAKSPKAPLLGISRLSASTPFDRLGSNYRTPNKSAIHKLSSSPYFKGPVSSRDICGTVSSSYQTANSVHTFGRQLLKRKNIALNNETVSVGPIRKMHQRYNRISSLSETWPGYRKYPGNDASKLDEGFEHSTQTQKRLRLAEVDDGTLCICGNSFVQAPVQSTEMAAKILKQLDTLVPSPPEKESTPEMKQKHGNALDVEDSISRRKEIPSQGSLLESSLSFIPAAIDGKTVDAMSNGSALLESKSSSELITSPKDSLEVDHCSGSIEIVKSYSPIQEHTANNSGTTNKENPPTASLRSYSPSNLVLSSEIKRTKMLASSNGFSFPVTAAPGAHSQAPPTPTMASPPALHVGKHKSSALPSVPVTSPESAPRILKRVSEESSISDKHNKKLNGEIPPVSSKGAGHVASFTSNPVFTVANSKPTTLSNGLEHTSKSTASAVLASNRPNYSFLSTNTASSQSARAPTSGSANAPFNFSPKFGGASLLAAQNKSKAGSSSAPFNFSPQFGSVNLVVSLDKSKVTSPESTLLSGNQFAQPGNNNSLCTQSSASKSHMMSPEESNMGSLPFGSAPLSPSPFSLSSVVSSTAASGTTSVITTSPLPLPSMASSALGSSKAFSVSPIFGSSPITIAPSSFGMPDNGSAMSISPSSAVFSFTSATPTIPDPPSSTPLFGSTIPTIGFSTGTGQMTVGNNQTLSVTAPPFGFQSNSLSTPAFSGFQSNSLSTPAFSMPATQFASTSTTSPGIFQFGQQNQASSGVFSMGTVRDNDKSGRRIVKVKRKK